MTASKTSNQKLSTKDITTDSMPISSEEMIGWIKSRRSMGNLDTPAPTREQIEKAIECAATAPDHQNL